ncbi:MAG: hypothetical protein LBH30_02760 [Prevotellaceae bacterium]|jgi:hypothetical protein|nr:hypothetical protein [Prevotellaceae bacterium]
MENKHVTPIPPEVLAQAQKKINEAIELLAPYMLPLTPTERRNLPKMGDKTLSFVEKAHEYSHHYPALCPSYINIEEFDTDVTDATGLRLCFTAP